MTLFPARRIRKGGYTLTEMVIAAAIMVVGGGIVYPLFIGDFGLYTRNFSINKSNNSLRTSLQHLKRDMDMAIEPPTLASYRVNAGAGVLKALPASTISAQAMFMWVNLGPTYCMQPTGGTVVTGGPIKLQRRRYVAGDTLPGPVPMVGDRLIIMSPGPYAAGMPETVSMDGGTVVKPGRAITAVNGFSGPNDLTTENFTVNIAAGTSALPTTIQGNQGVCIAREVAYVVYTINDAGGNAIERQLICYPNTVDMTTKQVLVRDLDPNPKETDPVTGSLIQPFNYYGGKGTLTALNVILPVRALDYASAIADRNSATAGTEFNVYLRSNTVMGIKARLVN